MEIKPVGQIEVVPNVELVDDICEYLESLVTAKEGDDVTDYNQLNFND